MYNTAGLKFFVMLVITALLNILCERGMSVISWLIVFIPFMFMTFIVTTLLYIFGLDVYTGTIDKQHIHTYNKDTNHKHTHDKDQYEDDTNTNKNKHC
jgi:hypothetical protein